MCSFCRSSPTWDILQTCQHPVSPSITFFCSLYSQQGAFKTSVILGDEQATCGMLLYELYELRAVFSPKVPQDTFTVKDFFNWKSSSFMQYSWTRFTSENEKRKEMSSILLYCYFEAVIMIIRNRLCKNLTSTISSPIRSSLVTKV